MESGERDKKLCDEVLVGHQKLRAQWLKSRVCKGRRTALGKTIRWRNRPLLTQGTGSKLILTALDRIHIGESRNGENEPAKGTSLEDMPLKLEHMGLGAPPPPEVHTQAVDGNAAPLGLVGLWLQRERVKSLK